MLKGDTLAYTLVQFEKQFLDSNLLLLSQKYNITGNEAYIKKAIELTHKHGALFIVDEMITGFKTDFPGTITKFDLDADMATWGKSIANGFSFCALTGKKEIMALGGIDKPGTEKVFLISTTHGGETHAIGAGLATIEFYKKNNVIEKNHQTAKNIKDNCNRILKEKGLQEYIHVSDTNWMLAFLFNDSNKKINMGYRTLFMQEMIKNNVLFQGLFVPSFSHNEVEIEAFLIAFSNSCDVYTQALKSSYENFLTGQPAKPVFRKLI